MSEFAHIPVAAIAPNPLQPRRNFDPEEIKALAKSIEHAGGILQPLLVRRAPARLDGQEFYELIAGERRLMAAKLVPLATAPCVIRDVSATDSGLMAAAENIARQDLTPLEEAHHIQALVEASQKSGRNLTQREIGEALGKTADWVNRRTRLLECPPDVQAMVDKNPDTLQHALRLKRVTNDNLRQSLIEDIEHGANLAHVNQAVDQFLEQQKRQKESLHAPDRHTTERQGAAKTTGSAPVSRGQRVTGTRQAEVRDNIESALNRIEGGLLHLKAWATQPGCIKTNQWRAVKLLIEQIEQQAEIELHRE